MSYVKALKNTFGMTYITDCIINFLLYIPRLFRLVDKPSNTNKPVTIGDLIKQREGTTAVVDHEMDTLQCIRENALDAVPLETDEDWEFPDLEDYPAVINFYDDIDVYHMDEGRNKSMNTLKTKAEKYKAIRKVTGCDLKQAKAFLLTYLKT